MGAFITLFVIAMCIAYPLLIKKSSMKEIVLFYLLSLAGATIWISIFIRHPINPLTFIGWVIDWFVMN
ncbi:hypothetical protein [Paenibacillus wynnii]|uniref:hypothetical protein n=1 Tax=Paenibacillus wynnii TaxID=268407 RepID=UPI00056B2BF5|nr:hypothetical protein [Paenibacillus wynnii]